jgi:transcriptional/translational regulatory protein YebC/TACO1
MTARKNQSVKRTRVGKPPTGKVEKMEKPAKDQMGKPPKEKMQRIVIDIDAEDVDNDDEVIDIDSEDDDDYEVKCLFDLIDDE